MTPADVLYNQLQEAKRQLREAEDALREAEEALRQTVRERDALSQFISEEAVKYYRLDQLDQTGRLLLKTLNEGAPVGTWYSVEQPPPKRRVYWVYGGRGGLWQRWNVSVIYYDAFGWGFKRSAAGWELPDDVSDLLGAAMICLNDGGVK